MRNIRNPDPRMAFLARVVSDEPFRSGESREYHSAPESKNWQPKIETNGERNNRRIP